MGTTRDQCPYDTEVWSVNMGYQQIATIHGRIDKIFMVHGQVYTKEGKPYFDWEHFRLLAENGCELFNIHYVKGVPFKKYPLRRIIEKFDFSYFSDTICYMIAYALYKNTKRDKETGKLTLTCPLKLRLYGCDMWELGEYADEKGGIEAWLSFALGVGAEVVISKGSSLFLTATGIPYGIDFPKKHYYDPFNLLKGMNPTKEEQAKIIPQLIAKMKKRKPNMGNFKGEMSEGLHREDIPETSNPE